MRFNYIFAFCAIAAIQHTTWAQSPIDASQVPQTWQYTEGYSMTSPTDDQWWSEFDDRTLDSLISMGVNNNYDILAAMRRIEVAKQAIAVTQAQYYPTINASAGYTAQRMSGTTTNPTTKANSLNYLSLGADMSWQIDVFGKVRERSRQSKASFRASRAEYDATMVTVTAKIATAYMQLRTLQATRSVLQRHIDQQQRVLDITRARHEAGIASMLDVTQANTTYLSTKAGITNLNAQIATTINAIAVLTGVFPEQIVQMLEKEKPMPEYRRLVEVGLPADLLRRRPDVLQAESNLAASAAAIGIAKKDFLPTLSLNAQIGTSAHRIDNMFTSRSLSYSVAPTLSWTVFDGMARKASLEQAKQQMQAAIDNYNLTVLTAVQEVENAMATYTNALEYIDMIYEVNDEAEKAFTLSLDLYKQGLTAFINVTQAQINCLQYSNELVSAEGSALNALINLYQALGGGWNM